MTELTTLTELNQKWEAIKGEIKNQTTIRIHRALSWLNRIDQCDRDDLDISISVVGWLSTLFTDSGTSMINNRYQRESWRVLLTSWTWTTKNDCLCPQTTADANSQHVRQQVPKSAFVEKACHCEPSSERSLRNKYQQWRQQKVDKYFDELLERIYLIRCQQFTEPLPIKATSTERMLMTAISCSKSC